MEQWHRLCLDYLPVKLHFHRARLSAAGYEISWENEGSIVKPKQEKDNIFVFTQ